MWTTNSTAAFNEWYDGLTDEERTEVIRKIESLKLFGPRLLRPHADTLAGSRHSNMKELRGRTSRAELRIAFAFDPERAAILLCAGNKTDVGQRLFYKRLLDLADRLFDEHLARLEQKRREKKGN